LQLSIIIVNYNVKFYLEQCLYSVQRALLGLDGEIIVVDNHSSDNSIDYLKPKFPKVQFLENNENMGFAKANNRGLAHAKGEYVLFLNPDTLVAENCFTLCIDFLNQNQRVGAIGVQMMDGMGRFLPESKRSFPSILSSFYKLMGLASLFPRSGIFNQYALGNLHKDQNQQVGVLAGAFFLVKKKIMVELKGFDEDFFMYGEDIDLSYRIEKAGYQNHYFAETAMIHFKGESSRKEGLTYVKIFYAAMMVFVQKHYSNGSARLFSYFIQFAISVRALLAMLKKILKPYILTIIDFVIVWASFKAVSIFWIYQIRNGISFGFEYLYTSFTLFSFLYIMLAAISGMYDQKYHLIKKIYAASISMVGVLAIYSLLPESLRFSRGVILWGGFIGGMIILFYQFLLAKRSSQLFEYPADQKGKTLIVATEEEFAKILKILPQTIPSYPCYSRISIDKLDTQALCNLQDLAWFEKTTPVSKIIFCAGSLSFIEIIKQVTLFEKRHVRLFFHSSGSQSIIGSGRYYSFENANKQVLLYRIQLVYQKRMKRVVDFALSAFFILTFPVHWLIQKNGLAFVRNTFRVLKGERTWVGYASPTEILPTIKKGILSHLGHIPNLQEDYLKNADEAYAQNYAWWKDTFIILKNYSLLGISFVESKTDE
jgi:GT2 family glycosyltransferase